MEKVVFFFLIICVHVNSYSQENLEFLGVLKIHDTTLISYRLKLKLNSNKVSGYSVTSIGGPHETKSYIRGKYFPDTNELQFAEYGIEYTKSDISEYDFCFVHFTGTVKKIEKQNVIQGKFFGKFEDGISCIDGDLMVRDINKIYKKAKKSDKKIKKLKLIPDSVRLKVNLTKTIDDKRLNVVKANENTSVFFNKDIIELKIWDAGKIDGDKITLIFNDSTILKNYEISQKIKKLKFRLKKGVNKVLIKAENVGQISPNTAKIELIGDNRVIDLLTNLDSGKETNLLLHNIK